MKILSSLPQPPSLPTFPSTSPDPAALPRAASYLAHPAGHRRSPTPHRLLPRAPRAAVAAPPRAASYLAYPARYCCRRHPTLLRHHGIPAGRLPPSTPHPHARRSPPERSFPSPCYPYHRRGRTPPPTASPATVDPLPTGLQPPRSLLHRRQGFSSPLFLVRIRCPSTGLAKPHRRPWIRRRDQSRRCLPPPRTGAPLNSDHHDEHRCCLRPFD
ncbi:extensin isoform X2 [Triticum aestivum]|uniref:extensin isoform X2 n=1 Tax=Triticum aestivum TaxID=4565 RepID=UPI001D01F34C|nr:extensin-like isoform X2 [Triticum aestivum]